MIHYSFDFICDGEGVLKRVVDGCRSMRQVGPLISNSERIAWINMRDSGWREAKWHGKTRHLCPVCWSKFLERK